MKQIMRLKLIGVEGIEYSKKDFIRFDNYSSFTEINHKPSALVIIDEPIVKTRVASAPATIEY
jgi:hypothetical protein